MPNGCVQCIFDKVKTTLHSRYALHLFKPEEEPERIWLGEGGPGGWSEPGKQSCRTVWMLNTENFDFIEIGKGIP